MTLRSVVGGQLQSWCVAKDRPVARQVFVVDVVSTEPDSLPACIIRLFRTSQREDKSSYSSAQQKQTVTGLKAYLTNPSHGGYVCQDALQLTEPQSYCAYVSAGSDVPTALAQVTNAWRSAWVSLTPGLQAVTSNPRTSLRVNDLASTAEHSTAQVQSDAITASAQQETFDRDETLQEKKKRAMDFLTAQGLGEFEITNGVA